MEGKNYLLTFELVGGQKQTLPLFVPKGDKGDKGVSITGVTLTEEKGLDFTMSDGSHLYTASVQGPKGTPGENYVLTEADKDEIAGIVYNSLSKAEGASF